MIPHALVSFFIVLGSSVVLAQTPPPAGAPSPAPSQQAGDGRPLLQGSREQKDAVKAVTLPKQKIQPGTQGAGPGAAGSGGAAAGGGSAGAAQPGDVNALTPSVPAPQSNEQLANVVAQVTEQAPDFTQIRDPFKQPPSIALQVAPKTPLENFPVDTLKMIAVMSGPRRKKALIAAPDGKNYIVMEKMKVGVRGGAISRITPDAILIREKIVNIVGEEEDLDTVLKIMAPAAQFATGEPGAGGT